MKILKNKNTLEKIMNNRKINMYEGFSTTSVSNVFKIKRGRVISQKYIENNRGEYPVYSSCASGDGAMGYIDSYNESGDMITWTTDGYYAGTVFFRTGNFNCTNICGILSLKESLDSEFNLKYLSYLLKKEFPKHITKTDNRKLMSNTVENINFLYCKSLYMQNKIADVLVNQEDQIHKIKKLIRNIEIRNQYYADKLTSGELKLNNSVCIIKEKFENVVNEHKKSKLMAGESLKTGLYPFFNCSKKQTLYSNEYLIDDSVLLLATGGNPSVNYYNGKISYSTDVWCLNSKYAKYLYYFYNANIDKIEQCFQGGGLKHLSKKDFKKIEIMIPNNDKDIQNIVDYLDNLNDEKDKVEKLLKLEEQRFEWLSDKLLSGEYIIED